MAKKKLQIICNTDKYKNFKKDEDVTNYLFGTVTLKNNSKQWLYHFFGDPFEKLTEALNDNKLHAIGLRHPKTHNCQYYLARNFIFK